MGSKPHSRLLTFCAALGALGATATSLAKDGNICGIARTTADSAYEDYLKDYRAQEPRRSAARKVQDELARIAELARSPDEKKLIDHGTALIPARKLVIQHWNDVLKKMRNRLPTQVRELIPAIEVAYADNGVLNVLLSSRHTPAGGPIDATLHLKAIMMAMYDGEAHVNVTPKDEFVQKYLEKAELEHCMKLAPRAESVSDRAVSGKGGISPQHGSASDAGSQKSKSAN